MPTAGAKRPTRAMLDKGYFSPDDDATWLLKNVVWTPTPIDASGSTAVFSVSYDAGLCWLGDDRSNSSFPEAGLQVQVQGQDAIGQSFNVAGRIYPYREVYQRSVSAVQIAKIPKWEWPMEFVKQVSKATTVLDGVTVSLKPASLQIGSVKVGLSSGAEKEASS